MRRPRALERVRVSSVERKPSVVAHCGDTIASVVERLHGIDEAVVPVLDDRGRLAGVVLASELAWHMARDPNTQLGAIARPAPAMVTATEPLQRAADHG